MKKIARLAGLLLLLPALSRAADTYTTRLGNLVMPALGSSGWGVKISSDILIISTAAASQYDPNTFIASNTFIGALLASNTSFTLTGSNGFIVSASSITANQFFGPLTGNVVGNVTGNVTGTVSGNVTAGQIVVGTGTFSGTGNSIYSISTSSGINIAAGGLYGIFAKMTTFFGNLVGNVTGNVTGNLTGNVTGNADTATSATTATTATNLASGAAGSIPYQTGSGATSFTAAGTAGQILVMAGGAVTQIWRSFLPETVTISTANVSPGINGSSQFVTFDSSGKYRAADGSAITNISGSISGLTSGYVPRASGATTIANGNQYETSTGTTHNLPFLFKSTVTFGNLTQGTTASYSAVVYGAQTLVASGIMTAANAITFTNLRSSFTYTFEMDAMCNTSASELRVIINNDVTAGRHFYSTTCNDSLGGSVIANSESNGYWAFNRDTCAVGQTQTVRVVFETVRGDGKRVVIREGTATAPYAGPHLETCKLGGSYFGVELSSMNFIPSVGTYTGWYRLKAEPWPF